jgi:peptidoglycan L-alanyl-D-glutamate endopeptidase CwlK
MPSFGKASEERYKTLHPDLQKILTEAIKYCDFSITCGYRNKEDQEKAFNEHKSTKQWPNSNHNKLPSTAVDIAPWPIDWDNRDRFIFLTGIIYCIAEQMNIKIRSGSNWSRSWQFEKQKFNDLPHIELIL